jgi:hypothetical protein
MHPPQLRPPTRRAKDQPPSCRPHVCQVHTATLLGTATLFSGTAWQPVVNTLHALGLEFTPAAACTMAFCGTAFFVGLRFGRLLWSPLMAGVQVSAGGGRGILSRTHTHTHTHTHSHTHQRSAILRVLLTVVTLNHHAPVPPTTASACQLRQPEG